MIARIKGTVLEKSPVQTIIDVNGVGYRLFITLSTYEALPLTGEEAVLQTVTIAREDSLSLYGFATSDEKEMFLQLVTVTRVGPRLACQALSGIKAEDMRRAILNNDKARLSSAPGIGGKTAERIIMELKEKLGPGGETVPSAESETAGDAIAALENLGYKKAQAQKAVAKVIGKTPDAELALLLRECLKELSPGR